MTPASQPIVLAGTSVLVTSQARTDPAASANNEPVNEKTSEFQVASIFSELNSDT